MRKSEQTKARLFQVALTMFAKQGFAATTMRGIASEAEVALGTTYYYFPSKENLVHEYYKILQEEHETALIKCLAEEKTFAKRLHMVVSSRIELAQPHKDMALALYQVAANPQSPLSPFSSESAELRRKALNCFREVVSGSKDKFHPDVKKILPELLWLFQMGIILFWIYDQSKDSAKTFAFIEKAVTLIDSLNQMIQSPFAAPFRKKILNLASSFLLDFHVKEVI